MSEFLLTGKIDLSDKYLGDKWELARGVRSYELQTTSYEW